MVKVSKAGTTNASTNVTKQPKTDKLPEWLDSVYKEYHQTTSNRLKAIDVYLLVILLTGAIQFLYCVLVGTFPFNSFLAGFISCVGSFTFGVCLRLQVDPDNKSMFGDISNERAFAEFLFAHLVLHLAVFNFIG